MTGRDPDCTFGQSNQDEQSESRNYMLCGDTSSGNASNSAQKKYPQADAHNFEENIVSKMRSKVDNVMTSVETRVQDTVLTTIQAIVIPRVELAMK